MDDTLISKKDLLKQYNISYGALYRWKRKGLIPEDWFIRKATSTGQETFFIRDLICPRMDIIIKNKDEDSLDSLAKKLNSYKEKAKRLIVTTEYDEREYLLSDIKSIKISHSDDSHEEILNYIKEKFYE